VNSLPSIGIVGLGFVGDALRQAITATQFPDNSANSLRHINLHTYDINPDTDPTAPTLRCLVNESDMIFVCVPTPSGPGGLCDTSIVREVINDIQRFASSHKIIVIKSTVSIGTTDSVQDLCKEHTIIFNPEFLTEANYRSDYLNGAIIIGRSKWAPMHFARLVAEVQVEIISRVSDTGTPPTRVRIVTAREAELFKYTSNIFLATKVSLVNELYDIAARLHIDWDTVRSLAVEDHRLGPTHWSVPGPDGRRGWGGTCLPKDLAAMIHTGLAARIPTPLLSAVWNRNVEIDRPERDWELLVGRAISEK